MILFTLLCAYGVCFGLQHKVKFIHQKIEFIDSMLECTYCTGFHAGWITYLIIKFLDLVQNGSLAIQYSEVFLYSFASAMWCYMIDVIIQHFEQ